MGNGQWTMDNGQCMRLELEIHVVGDGDRGRGGGASTSDWSCCLCGENGANLQWIFCALLRRIVWTWILAPDRLVSTVERYSGFDQQTLWAVY